MKKSELKRLVAETEEITYTLPACGTEQTVNARYGGTDIDMGDLNVYLSEGRLAVRRWGDNGLETLLEVEVTR